MIRTNLKALRIAAIVVVFLVILLIFGMELFSRSQNKQRLEEEIELALAPSSVVFPNAFNLKETEDGIQYQLSSSGRLMLKDTKDNTQYVLTSDGKVYRVDETGALEEVDETTTNLVLNMATPIIDEDDSLSSIFSGVTESIDPKFVRQADGTIVQIGQDGKPEYVILPDGTVMAVSDTGSYSMVDEETAMKIFSEAIASMGEDIPEYMVSPDGSVIKFDENGNPKYVIQPDGSMIKLGEDGTTEYIIQPDGTVFYIDENGELVKVSDEEASKIYQEAQEVLEGAKDVLGDNFPIKDINEKESDYVARSDIFKENSSYKQGSTTPEDIAQAGLVANIGGLNNSTSNQSSSSPNYGYNYDPTSSTAALAESMMASQRTQSKYDQQNAQGAKKSFMSDFKDIEGSAQLSNTDLAAGTVINMTLITGLNSDLPGQIVAQVNQNVYDTLTGRNLLIPKGTRLIASYDSSVSWGQKRALVAWTQLIRPDGFVLYLPGLPGIDAQGYTGYQDKVNNHVWSMIGAALLASIIDLGAEEVLIQAEDAGIENPGLNAVGSFTGTLQSAGQQWLSKVIERQPTLTIRPGRKISLLVTDTLNLKPYRGN